LRSQLEAGPAATRAAAVAERQGLRAKWRNLPKAGKVAIAIALLGALAAAVPPLAPVVVTILIIPFLVKAAPTWAKKFEEEEQKRLKAAQQIICPHCGNRGSVRFGTPSARRASVVARRPARCSQAVSPFSPRG
jgi:hypothetical protein